GPAILDDDVLTLGKASFFEALAKSTQTVLDHRARRSVVEKPDRRHRRLLRARRERPRDRSAAEQRYKRASPHWASLLRLYGRTLPHRCARTPLCITAKLIAEWQRRVKSLPPSLRPGPLRPQSGHARVVSICPLSGSANPSQFALLSNERHGPDLSGGGKMRERRRRSTPVADYGPCASRRALPPDVRRLRV